MINLKMDAFRFFFFQYGNIFLNPISGLNKRKRIHPTIHRFLRFLVFCNDVFLCRVELSRC